MNKLKMMVIAAIFCTSVQINAKKITLPLRIVQGDKTIIDTTITVSDQTLLSVVLKLALTEAKTYLKDMDDSHFGVDIMCDHSSSELLGFEGLIGFHHCVDLFPLGNQTMIEVQNSIDKINNLRKENNKMVIYVRYMPKFMGTFEEEKKKLKGFYGAMGIDLSESELMKETKKYFPPQKNLYK